MDEDKKNNNGSDELAELKEKLELLAKERDEYLNGWRRAKADFTNYKNEEMARLEEMAKFGSAEIIKEIISVLQSLDLAIKEDQKSGRDPSGLAVIRSQLDNVLKKRGLREMEPQAGKQFDPAVHEVLSQIESDEPEGTVLEVLDNGYRLYDKVLRPAKVKISSGPPPNAKPVAGEDINKNNQN